MSGKAATVIAALVGGQVDFVDLVGEHYLSGVEFGTGPRGEYDESAPNTMTFILDDVAYQATEDPSDGYRSSLATFEVVDGGFVSNRFEPVKVTAELVTKTGDPSYTQHQSDILCLRDAQSGKSVLEVGTDRSDDYYPSYVANFTPENMAINAKAA